MTASIPLAGGFHTATEADWRAGVLRSGIQPDRDLAGSSDDGIPIGPIYQRVVGKPIEARPAGRTWRIIQRVSARDAGSALAQCRDEIAGGADGVALVFADSIHPLPSALPPNAAEAIAAGLVESVENGAAVTIDAGPRTPDIAPAFADVAAACSLAFDPVAVVAAGRPGEADAAVARLAGLADSFTGTLALADGRIWHAAGASEVQELAAVLATVIEQLRLFAAHGLAPDRAAARIGVALTADTDQFLTIARLRAVRLLLRRALDAAGIAATLPVHAETAWRTMSRREPRMNVLRATGAAFAAAVGGADSITVLPFDALARTAGAEALRLARNTQLVIAEEAQVARFADPAAGSGAVESLTEAMAERAWTHFQTIEAAGGMLAALAAGSVQSDIAAMRAARLARVAEGAVEMIGVNAFIAESDEPLSAQDQPGAGATGALVFTRLAEDAEARA